MPSFRTHDGTPDNKTNFPSVCFGNGRSLLAPMTDGLLINYRMTLTAAHINHRSKTKPETTAVETKQTPQRPAMLSAVLDASVRIFQLARSRLSHFTRCGHLSSGRQNTGRVTYTAPPSTDPAGQQNTCQHNRLKARVKSVL